MAAAVSESARTSFNPSWMGSTYAGGSGAPASVSRSASANDAGPAPLGTIHHGDANSNNSPMAPPKLSKHRYGREDLLALQPAETHPPPYLKEKFPEFYIHEPQQPVCLSTFSDTEERLLMQGGINSSKVMSAISHAERPGFEPPRPGFHPRWQQDAGPPGGPPPFVGRGFGPPRGGFGGYLNPYHGGRGRAGPMMGPGGPPGGMDNTRFGGMGGRGRGAGMGMGGRGGGTTGQGGDRGGAGGAFNSRAQGLYDPKDPRDRPRQRVKSVGESGMGGPGGGPYGGGMGRGRGWEGRGQDGEPIPAWMDSDEEGEDLEMGGGTFDDEGQFRREEGDTRDREDGREEKGGRVERNGGGGEVRESWDDEDTHRPKEERVEHRERHKPRLMSTPGKITNNSTDKEKEEHESSASPPEHKQPQQQVVTRVEAPPPAQNAWFSKPRHNTPPTTNYMNSASATSNAPQSKSAKIVENISINSASDARKGVEANATKPIDIPKVDQRRPEPLAQREKEAKLPKNTEGLPTTNMPAPMGARQEGRRRGGEAGTSMSMERINLAGPMGGEERKRLAEILMKQRQMSEPGRKVETAEENFTKIHQDVESLVNSFGEEEGPSTADQIRQLNTQALAEKMAVHSAQHPRPPPADAPPGSSARGQREKVPSPVKHHTHTPSPPAQPQVLNPVRMADKWVYLDPNHQIQGPFSNEQMQMWFSSGYFHMQLMVKRTTEPEFKPLGDVIKMYGKVPFIPTVGLDGRSLSGKKEAPQPVPQVQSVWDDSDVQAAAVAQAARAVAAQQQAAAVAARAQQARLEQQQQQERVRRAEEEARKQEEMARLKMEEEARLEKARELEMARIQAEREKQRREQEEMERRRMEEERLRKIQEEEEERKRVEEAKRKELERAEQQKKIEALARKQAAESAERQRKWQEEEGRRQKETQEEAFRRQQAERAEMQERMKVQQDLQRRREEESRMTERPSQQISIHELLGVQSTQGSQDTVGGRAWGASAPENNPPPPSGWSGVAGRGGGRGKESGGGGGMSLLDIQREEERQMLAEKKQQQEIDTQRRTALQSMNVKSNCVWGNASKALSWESSVGGGGGGGGAWGGAGMAERHNSQGVGFWDEADTHPPPTSHKRSHEPKLTPTKKEKRNDRNSTASQKQDKTPKKTEASAVKRLFAQSGGESDKFVGWIVKQVQQMNSDVDAPTFAHFLKEVESPHEDLAVPAAALDAAGGAGAVAGAQMAAATKKKKKGGKFAKPVAGSVLGFTAAADPNRVNVGEIETEGT